jgi:UDP-3-O-[3-hydroxymyristoyl] N-acetylglucosamine deacetylase
MGIDNAIVELDGPEVPIMDGSATPHLVLLEEAGVKKQAVPRQTLRVCKPFVMEDGGKRLAIQPSNAFRVTYEIEFDHPLIRTQRKTVLVDDANYENLIAPARTFGFLKDVNHLKSRGLIQGGSLDNAIVLDGDRILNESLRLDDEFVSHKILDLIGDFALSGMRFQGHVYANKAGHELHARCLRALIASKHVEIVTETLEAEPQLSPLVKPLAGVA